MKRFLKVYGIEQKLFFRSGDVFIFNLCMPVAVLVMIALIAGNKAAISALLVSGVSVAAFGYRMEGNPLAFIGGWTLTLAAMFSIGLLIASLCRTVKMMNAVTSIVYFPMLFLSGATIPYELFPKGLQHVADVLPLTQGIKLMKALSMGQNLNGMYGSIVLLLAITVVCSIVSVLTFRWE